MATAAAMISETQIGDSYLVPGLSISDHKLSVPLDYSGELSGNIDLFFRVVTHRNKENSKLPYLLYLQGGPGFESPRPMDCSGWMKTAVEYFHVVLMDQRGTGLSSGISADRLTKMGSPADQARFLKCFRADSIVTDAEALRSSMGVSRWSIIGQSFGGFCCASYLSMAPQSLTEVLMTGGIPPGITSPCSADNVYVATFQRVMGQNNKFYSRFPAAVPRAQRIVLHLASQPGGALTTPGGNTLSPRSFQLLGLHTLGFSHGLERLHYMLESAFDADGNLSQRFLKDFDGTMAWDTNPLYALLHESIYCQGAASNWAAHRVRCEHYAHQFDAVAQAQAGMPVFFTGEMVFPWMFDEFAELRKVKDAAEILAADAQWGKLYDVEKLRANTVPTAAASYFEDMFVDFNLAQETAREIAGLRQHVTSEFLHDGIREQGGALFERLLNMVRGGTLLR